MVTRLLYEFLLCLRLFSVIVRSRRMFAQGQMNNFLVEQGEGFSCQIHRWVDCFRIKNKYICRALRGVRALRIRGTRVTWFICTLICLKGQGLCPQLVFLFNCVMVLYSKGQRPLFALEWPRKLLRKLVSATILRHFTLSLKFYTEDLQCKKH